MFAIKPFGGRSFVVFLNIGEYSFHEVFRSLGFVYKAVFPELCVDFLKHDLRLAGRSSLDGTRRISSLRLPITLEQFCFQGFQHCVEISLISFSSVSLHKRGECLF